ncbi:hypothetical protein FM036_25705 [Nostoc sp. HG1]|nr:hypothetical protein [Nostoc sp. HG1]
MRNAGSGSTDKTVKLWNLQSGELYRSLGEHLNWVQAVRISQDSRFLISGSRDGDIKFWQADSDIENQSKSSNSDDTALIAKIIAFIFLIVISKFTAEEVFWIGLAFLSLGDLVGKKNKGAFILNISKLKCSHSIHQESSDTVNNLVISHDGKNLISKNLISVSDDNTTKQWCIETKQLICTFAGDSGFVSSAAISPDGKILATASNDWIKLWNLHTGQSLHPLKGCAESRLSDISIFSDARLQLSCQEQEITVTASVGDINTSTVINVIEPARLTTLVISPQEVELKPGEHQQFSLQNLDQRGNAIATEKIAWSATGGTIEPDGNFLVNQNAKGDFSIWACAIEQNITAIAKVTIPVVLQRLEIFPKKIQLEPNEIQTFTIRAFDQGGDEIAKIIVNWQCTTGGLIDDQGMFIGNYDTEIVDIIATVGNVSDVACVCLLPVLKSLEIEPQGTQLKPNEQINLRVRGFDQFRNEVKIQNIHWQTTEGKIYPDGTFVAVDRDANITVSATVGNIEGTAHFKVIEPFKLTELVIYPQQVVMNPGQYQHFEVIGLDQRGDAPIVVSVPPVLKRLEIFPPKIQLEPEETQTFTVIGFDQYGDQIHPGAIFWEATGGEIDLNGTFIADFNAKGQFLVAATSRSTPKLTKKSKTLLFNVSISIRLLSYVLRLLAQVQDEFVTESNTEETSEVSTTVTEIDNFELELQAWITKTIIKLASRFLVVISRLCLNQATDNLSASAEVTVIPVLRHLEVSPPKVQLKPDETINFTVKGLDQHCDEIDVNNVSWKATDGNINSHGILSVDDKCSNVTITATVGTISNFAHGTVVKAPQIISRTNSPIPADVKLVKALNNKVFTFIKNNNHHQVNQFVSNKNLESTLEDELSNAKLLFRELDFEYEDKYEFKYKSYSPNNGIDNSHRSYEKSSWFYRSQLYYDGFAPNEFSGDYNDYLSYQDEISYIEFLM